uniref:Lipoprotein n=1 Tax=Dulem virus 267 TaxID=3145744 RepID=A0AAU8ATX8_9VIRU
MNKKDILIIILKVVIYACTLFLSVLGVTSLASCSVSRDTSVFGKATIVTTDTTYVLHNTFLNYKNK